MCAQLTPRRIADDLFEFDVDTSQDAQTLASQIRELNLAEDVVAGMKTVCVRFCPENFSAIETALQGITSIRHGSDEQSELVELSIKYGGAFGPDLTKISEAMGVSEADLVDLHTRQEHRVEMIGFTPGFAYVSGLPDEIAIARLSDPRPRVPAGSVGMSSKYTGVYALDGPGGWPLIGQVQDVLFDADADEPFRLLPGHRIKFRAV